MTAAATLLIQHLAQAGELLFQVVRLPDGKRVPKPVPIRSPALAKVENRPDSNLLSELEWYLERFLEYPFPPATERADRVQSALRLWGTDAFNALFNSRAAGRMFDAATTDDYERLHVQIASDDPRVLSWPWEALRDPELGYLSHTCQIERRLDSVREPRPLAESLPRDRLNVLLVVARPYERDVHYASVARPLIELIEREDLPIRVEILRPPSFTQLLHRLNERPGYYHLLHFDGHGSSGDQRPSVNAGHTMAAEGHLIFESEAGKPEKVGAEQLSVLLSDYAIPAVVLNACQSAKILAGTDDPFAAVATALLRAGIRSVVAMAYSLYVSGAQQFLPAFYRRLVETGSVSRAARAGRRQMFEKPDRICVRGRFPLQDWLLPVLYEQDPGNFPIQAKEPAGKKRQSEGGRGDGGFVGRDSALLALERALRRSSPALLIHGLGGIGKSTLAKAFVRWLRSTEGLNTPELWFDFQEIHSAEHVINRIADSALDASSRSRSAAEKLEDLCEVLRKDRWLVIWDNFEFASGTAGAGTTGKLAEADRSLLLRFLDGLKGGASKTIITSRSEEDWLATARHWRFALSGLEEREEQGQFCDLVFSEFGLEVDRGTPDFAKLLKLLAGHPLVIRAVLIQLRRRSSASIVESLQKNFDNLQLGATDEAQKRVLSALQFVETGIPDTLRPLLIPLSLHAAYVETEGLTQMASWVPGPLVDRSQVCELLRLLAEAGLARMIETRTYGREISDTYELHPLLSSYLRRAIEQSAPELATELWTRAFIEGFASFARSMLGVRVEHRQQPMLLHRENLYSALHETQRRLTRTEKLRKEAERAEEGAGKDQLGQYLLARAFDSFSGLRGLEGANEAILFALAGWAEYNRDLNEAERLYLKLTESSHSGAAFRHLGYIAKERRELQAARDFYERSLDQNLALSDGDRANSYSELGILAESERDFAAAEGWFRKSLQISEQLGDLEHIASAYHYLGRIAEQTQDLDAAEEWLTKAAELEQKLGEELSAATTYHELGIVAQDQGRLDAAEAWFMKSLRIKEKFNDEYRIALTCHALGIVAQMRQDYAGAEAWALRSLQLREKLKAEYDAAKSYYQLGTLAHEQRDFTAAEAWLKKARAVLTKYKDEHLMSLCLYQLGLAAYESGKWDVAEDWYRQAAPLLEKVQERLLTGPTYVYLGNLAMRRNDLRAAEEFYRRAVGLAEKGEDFAIVGTAYHNLGNLLHERPDLAEAAECHRKALAIAEQRSDQGAISSNCRELGLIAQEGRDLDAAEAWFLKALKSAESSIDRRGTAACCCCLAWVTRPKGELARAEQYCRTALEIVRELGQDALTGDLYAEMGMIAMDRGQMPGAEKWFQLVLEAPPGPAFSTAKTQAKLQLGVIASKKGDFGAAEKYSREALEASQAAKDWRGVSEAAFNLGAVAEDCGANERAKEWYEQSLDLQKRMGNWLGVAGLCGTLGNLAGKRGQFLEAGQRLLESYKVFKERSPEHAPMVRNHFFQAYSLASAGERILLKRLWDEKNIGPFEDSYQASPWGGCGPTRA